jgi:accessory gene regulator B
MLTRVSNRLAIALSKSSGREADVDYLRYGLEILLGGLVKTILLWGTAYMLGIVPTMVWTFATFALFRSLTGGHHYSTYGRCLTAGLIILNGMAYAAVKLPLFIQREVVWYALIGAVILGFILVYMYAPANHFYKKNTELQKRNLRKFSLVSIAIWALLMYYLFTGYYSIELVLASIMGFFFQICSLHPVTFKTVEVIEHFIDRRSMK